MSEPDGDLASRLERVEESLRGLRVRLDRIEAAALRGVLEPGEDRGTPSAAEAGAASGGALAAASVERESLEGIRLTGRTVLALAGGYLIRALTDSGSLSPTVGVAAGFAYALAFTFLALRAGRAGQRASADFHALSGALMVYPLLVETSVRLGWLPPRVALVGLVLAFAASHLVGLALRNPFLAWLGSLLATATGLVLLVASHDVLAGGLTLFMVAVIVESTMGRGFAEGVRWVAALALDAAVLALVLVAGRPGDLPEGYPVVGVTEATLLALALPALYLVSIALATLRRGESIGAFAVSQAAVALLVGFGGGAQILRAHDAPGVLLPVAAALLGGLAYTAAFAFVERRSGQAANFYFYSTAGGFLTLAAWVWMLPEPVWILSGLALAAAWFGDRHDRQTLRYHGVAYLVAAASSSGLLSLGIGHLLGRGLAGLGPPPLPAWVALGATLAVYAVLAPDPLGAGARVRVPQAIVGALLVVGLDAALAGTLVAALGAADSAPMLATVRTGVLAAVSLGAAEASRRRSMREMEWLVYPLLALGGLKLLTEDLPSGRAATLAASFLLYGTALTLAPRLARSGRDSSQSRVESAADAERRAGGGRDG